MDQFVAFLRGINVGGNALIKMDRLKACLSESGLSDVNTYLQSGNVILRSTIRDKPELAERITAVIQQEFGLDVPTVLFRGHEWRQVIASAPEWWGSDKTWRHNVLILLRPADIDQVVTAIGPLKADVEALGVGDGMLYQSIALSAVGRGATGSKLISNPVYRQLTIRNYNTATRLATLLN